MSDDPHDGRLIPPPIEWSRAIMIPPEKWVALNEQIETLKYAITRWSNATHVVGSHRSCSCAVCEALYSVAEQFAGEVCE